MSKNPQNVTIYGYLSWPKFNYKEAVEWNQRSKFPNADVSKIRPEFHLLVKQAQLDKLVDHIKTVFLPFTETREKAGERGNALNAKQVAKLDAWLDAGDWEDQPPYMLIKPIDPKTAEQVPDAVASIKISGLPGQDISQMAIVQDESELAVPDPDILKFPVLKGIQETVHQLQPGAIAAATVNLYAFVTGNMPGVNGSASTAVFKEEGVRFGGSTDVDESEIFLD